MNNSHLLNLNFLNREVFGDVTTKLKATDYELNNFDLLAEVRDLVESEKERRRDMTSEAWKLSRWTE